MVRRWINGKQRVFAHFVLGRLAFLFFLCHPGTLATFGDAKQFLEHRFPNRDLLVSDHGPVDVMADIENNERSRCEQRPVAHLRTPSQQQQSAVSVSETAAALKAASSSELGNHPRRNDRVGDDLHRPATKAVEAVLISRGRLAAEGGVAEIGGDGDFDHPRELASATECSSPGATRGRKRDRRAPSGEDLSGLCFVRPPSPLRQRSASPTHRRRRSTSPPPSPSPSMLLGLGRRKGAKQLSWAPVSVIGSGTTTVEASLLGGGGERGGRPGQRLLGAVKQRIGGLGRTMARRKRPRPADGAVSESSLSQQQEQISLELLKAMEMRQSAIHVPQRLVIQGQEEERQAGGQQKQKLGVKELSALLASGARDAYDNTLSAVGCAIITSPMGRRYLTSGGGGSTGRALAASPSQMAAYMADDKETQALSGGSSSFSSSFSSSSSSSSGSGHGGGYYNRPAQYDLVGFKDFDSGAPYAAGKW